MLNNIFNPNLESTYRANYINFRFTSDLMLELARQNKKVDVLFSQSGDSFGYDLVFNCDNGIVRHFQMKAKKQGVRVGWKVHQSLINDPNGYLIVAEVELTNGNMDINVTYHYWDRNLVTQLQTPYVKYAPDTKYNRVTGKHLIKNKTVKDIATDLFK